MANLSQLPYSISIHISEGIDPIMVLHVFHGYFFKNDKNCEWKQTKKKCLSEPKQKC